MSVKHVCLAVSALCLISPLRGWAQTAEDRLRSVERAIENPTNGLSPRLGAVESKIGDPKTGLTPRVNGLEKRISDPVKGIDVRVGKVESAINDPADAQLDFGSKRGLAPRVERIEVVINDPQAGLQITGQTLKRLWVLLAALLVFFMQAGFLCLEVGMGRRRHEASIAMMNLMNWLVVCVVFYCWGFGFMFGNESLNGFLGVNLFFPTAAQVQVAYKPLGLGMEFLLFQLAFAATTATIVDGAIAERAALFPYFLATILTSTFVYPVFGHWAWNDLGWLKHIFAAVTYKSQGFHDFAGSTVVHSVGAWIAIVAVKFVGPRRYFSVDRSVFPPNSIGLAAVGVIMLWFGWWGFNGGSLLKYDSTIASIILHTNLAGGAAGIVSYLHALMADKGNVYSKAIGGTLGGLVAITACCDVANPVSALLVGATAGVVHNWVFDRLPGWGIDDVAGAIPVHGACGVWGTLCTGFIIWSLPGGSPWQILVQLIGIAAALGLAVGLSWVIFGILAHTIGLRVSVVEEDGGQRGMFDGRYDGSLQVSRRYGWKKLPLFWSRFGPFEDYLRRIRIDHPTNSDSVAFVTSQVRSARIQVIRMDGTPARQEDLESAVGGAL
jgi:Amt family ammonium transporter